MTDTTRQNHQDLRPTILIVDDMPATRPAAS